MTLAAAWVRRRFDLSFPWVDPTWQIRYHDLLQRVEASGPRDHGEVETLFPIVEDVATPTLPPIA